ncbi:MAG: hypothetical protein AB1349_11750 [Elusimicrobiota bacterium]
MKYFIIVICVFSLIFPVLMELHTFFYHSEAVELGLLWLSIGHHFVLLPLFILIVILSLFNKKIRILEKKISYLPLVTWLLMTGCFLLYFLMGRAKVNTTIFRQKNIILGMVLIFSIFYVIKSVYKREETKNENTKNR